MAQVHQRWMEGGAWGRVGVGGSSRATVHHIFCLSLSWQTMSIHSLHFQTRCPERSPVFRRLVIGPTSSLYSPRLIHSYLWLQEDVCWIERKSGGKESRETVPSSLSTLAFPCVSPTLVLRCSHLIGGKLESIRLAPLEQKTATACAFATQGRL